MVSSQSSFSMHKFSHCPFNHSFNYIRSLFHSNKHPTHKSFRSSSALCWLFFKVVTPSSSICLACCRTYIKDEWRLKKIMPKRSSRHITKKKGCEKLARIEQTPKRRDSDDSEASSQVGDDDDEILFVKRVAVPAANLQEGDVSSSSTNQESSQALAQNQGGQTLKLGAVIDDDDTEDDSDEEKEQDSIGKISIHHHLRSRLTSGPPVQLLSTPKQTEPSPSTLSTSHYGQQFEKTRSELKRKHRKDRQQPRKWDSDEEEVDQHEANPSARTPKLAVPKSKKCGQK